MTTLKTNTTRLSLILLLASFSALGAPASGSPGETATKSKTADWYRDADCRMVFFTVLEGLYEDGIPQEVVDLVIGRVEDNNIDKAFVFRCKLCHACYEAFAVYQRRPAFNGAEGVNTIGNRVIAPALMEGLKSGSQRQFDAAFSGIIQPWVKQKLLTLNQDDADKIATMKRFGKLAREGNALVRGYERCQACEAIKAVAQTLADRNR